MSVCYGKNQVCYDIFNEQKRLIRAKGGVVAPMHLPYKSALGSFHGPNINVLKINGLKRMPKNKSQLQ